MSFHTIALYALFLLIVLALVKPLGGYMARVFAGQSVLPLFGALVVASLGYRRLDAWLAADEANI